MHSAQTNDCTLPSAAVTVMMLVLVILAVVFLLQPPVPVSLLLPDLSYGSLDLLLFVSQRVSEHLGGQLQLWNPHMLCRTGPAVREGWGGVEGGQGGVMRGVGSKGGMEEKERVYEEDWWRLACLQFPNMIYFVSGRFISFFIMLNVPSHAYNLSISVLVSSSVGP